MTLNQLVTRVVRMARSPPPTRLPAAQLTRNVAGLLLVGDLRNYTKVARVVDADFVVNPQVTRNGLLYLAGPSFVSLKVKVFQSNPAESPRTADVAMVID